MSAGINVIAGLLEKTLTKTKDMSQYLLSILNNLRNDNIAVTVNLNTAVTTTSRVNLNDLIAGKAHSLTVLSPGGGLFIQTSLSDPFEVFFGDTITDEDIGSIHWYGAGAGTAVLRITGLNL